MKITCTAKEKAKLIEIFCNSFADCLFGVEPDENGETMCNTECSDCYGMLIDWEVAK